MHLAPSSMAIRQIPQPFYALHGQWHGSPRHLVVCWASSQLFGSPQPLGRLYTRSQTKCLKLPHLQLNDIPIFGKCLIEVKYPLARNITQRIQVQKTYVGTGWHKVCQMSSFCLGWGPTRSLRRCRLLSEDKTSHNHHRYKNLYSPAKVKRKTICFT